MAQRENKKCLVEGCNYLSYRQNYCYCHLYDINKKKIPIKDLKPRTYNTQCLVPNCPNLLDGKYFCHKHRINCFYSLRTKNTKSAFYKKLLEG